jgi:hypothetical protein
VPEWFYLFKSLGKRHVLRLFLSLFFLVAGVALITGLIFPGLPEETGIRTMLGIVSILFGVYRGVIFFFVPPRKRRPYGGPRPKILRFEKEDRIERSIGPVESEEE